jgi:methyl-accepting chemotaxis protein
MHKFDDNNIENRNTVVNELNISLRWRMKIGTSLKIIALSLLVFSFISAFSAYWGLNNMNGDGRVVNYAGIIRGGTQRLIKLELSGKPSDELMAKLDRIMRGLQDGDAELKLPRMTDPEFEQALKETEASWGRLKETIQKARHDEALRDSLVTESEAYFDLTNQTVSVAENVARRKVSTSKMIQTAFFLLNLSILVPIMVFGQKKLARPLVSLADKMDLIGNGNLQVSIEHAGSDEIGTLSKNLNVMVEHLNTMINGILTNANNVISTVDVLRSRGDAVASGAKDQSAQAAQIAAASEEMSQTIVDIAKNASSAAQTSADAMEIASKGKAVADGAVETVNKVYTSSIELSTLVEKLNNRVREIGNIVTVIKGIADQTNLLALNAAIEAARAGEQGRGFAVVADEVRKLAERTINATAEISEKIDAVQIESEQTTNSMAQASTDVTQAAQYIKNVGGSLNEIVDAVQKARDQITQIATAVDEQSAASEEVTNNIEKTSGIAINMEKMSDDVMHQVNALIKIAEELRNSTAGFRTRGMN